MNLTDEEFTLCEKICALVLLTNVPSFSKSAFRDSIIEIYKNIQFNYEILGIKLTYYHYIDTRVHIIKTEKWKFFYLSINDNFDIIHWCDFNIDSQKFNGVCISSYWGDIQNSYVYGDYNQFKQDLIAIKLWAN